MDKIREALEALVDGRRSGLFSCDVEADTTEELEAKIEDARERWSRAEAALSAPVASDARELAGRVRETKENIGIIIYPEMVLELDQAAALIERYAAERERKAREEEREACAERFIRDFCGMCTKGEYDTTRCPPEARCEYAQSHIAAIKEAGK